MPATGTVRRREHSERSALSVHALTVAYDRRPVLWDVELEIPRGVLVGIIGPNGAGKSTLLKACMGLLPALAGDVRFMGQPIDRIRRRIAYVPQRESVDWDFPITALDVASMGAHARLGWFGFTGRAARDAGRRALDEVGLADVAHRQIGRLSGGQQQRVFLARALAQDPEVFLMDEPFASVDAATEADILAILGRLRNAGRTLLVVHHDLAVAREAFDWTVLVNTRVVAAGPTAEVMTDERLRLTYGGRLPVMEEAAERVARAARGLREPRT